MNKELINPPPILCPNIKVGNELSFSDCLIKVIIS